MESTFIITANTENVPQTLQRITSLMTRNRLKMQHMNVIETDSNGSAHLSLALRSNEETVEKLIKQLSKFTDLLDVTLTHKTK